MIHVCLIEPEIPQNTGNIARTVAVTGSVLELVHPLGFDISEKAARHAGLDYWKDVEKKEWKDKDTFLSSLEGKNAWFFSSHAERLYTEADYSTEDVYLVFGKESVGLGKEILGTYGDRSVKIPMREGSRCLNLSNSVAIAVYEALKTRGFQDLETPQEEL